MKYEQISAIIGRLHSSGMTVDEAADFFDKAQKQADLKPEDIDKMLLKAETRFVGYEKYTGPAPVRYTDPKVIEKRQQIRDKVHKMVVEATKIDIIANEIKPGVERTIQRFMKDERTPEGKAYNAELRRIWGSEDGTSKGSKGTPEEKIESVSEMLMQVCATDPDVFNRVRTDEELVELFETKENYGKIAQIAEIESLISLAKEVGADQRLIDAADEIRVKCMFSATYVMGRFDLMDNSLYVTSDQRDFFYHSAFPDIGDTEFMEPDSPLAEAEEANNFQNYVIHQAGTIDDSYSFSVSNLMDGMVGPILEEFYGDPMFSNSARKGRMAGIPEGNPLEYREVFKLIAEGKPFLIKNPKGGKDISVVADSLGNVKIGECPDFKVHPGKEPVEPQKPEEPQKPKEPGAFSKFIDKVFGILNFRFVPVMNYETDLEEWEENHAKWEKDCEKWEKDIKEYEIDKRAWEEQTVLWEEQGLEAEDIEAMVINSAKTDIRETPEGRDLFVLNKALSEEVKEEIRLKNFVAVKESELKRLSEKYHASYLQKDPNLTKVFDENTEKNQLYLEATLNSKGTLSKDVFDRKCADCVAAIIVNQTLKNSIQARNDLPDYVLKPTASQDYIDKKIAEIKENSAFQDYMKKISPEKLKSVTIDINGKAADEKGVKKLINDFSVFFKDSLTKQLEANEKKLPDENVQQKEPAEINPLQAGI